jgi:Flp pilus assembly protein TadG
VTNTATDSDIPANVLTYQLINPPTGASISTNGVITWTPNAGQGPSTNTITTVVTDSNPWAVNAQHLSATNSFTVIVTGGSTTPVIQSIRLTNGIVTIKWSAVSGQSYRLQYKGNLTDSVWSDATPDFTAMGPIATGTNGVNNATQRYYRVLLLQ